MNVNKTSRNSVIIPPLKSVIYSDELTQTHNRNQTIIASNPQNLIIKKYKLPKKGKSFSSNKIKYRLLNDYTQVSRYFNKESLINKSSLLYPKQNLKLNNFLANTILAESPTKTNITRKIVFSRQFSRSNEDVDHFLRFGKEHKQIIKSSNLTVNNFYKPSLNLKYSMRETKKKLTGFYAHKKLRINSNRNVSEYNYYDRCITEANAYNNERKIKYEEMNSKREKENKMRLESLFNNKKVSILAYNVPKNKPKNDSENNSPSNTIVKHKVSRKQSQIKLDNKEEILVKDYICKTQVKEDSGNNNGDGDKENAYLKLNKFFRYDNIVQFQKNPPKTSYFVEEKLFDLPNFWIFGFFEGKGENAHILASVIKKIFLNILTEESSYFPNVDNIPTEINEDLLYTKIKENNYYVINKIYNDVYKQVSLLKLDIEKCASSCMICFLVGSSLIISSIGYSKCLCIIRQIVDSIENLNSVLINSESGFNVNEKELFHRKKDNESIIEIKPIIEEINIKNKCVKGMIICNEYFYYNLGRNNIARAVCKGTIYINNKNKDKQVVTTGIITNYKENFIKKKTKNKEKELEKELEELNEQQIIYKIANNMINLYKSMCKMNNINVEEADFILVYF